MTTVLDRNPSPHSTACRQEQAATLIDLAHQRLLVAMQKHGNAISPLHCRALRDLMEGLTRQALGIDTGRHAYAMPCGAGKTLGMKVWLATAWGLGTGISVAVSACQIEALCQIKDDLIRFGVPEAAIGMRHSYGDAVRWPDTGDADRPFMLVSHARIRGRRDEELFREHRGEPRSLLIWDESLLATQADSLSLTSVKSSAGAMLDMLGGISPLRASLARGILDLHAEVEGQRGGATPQILALLDDVDLQAARAELQGLRCRDQQQRTSVDTMRSLLRLTQGPVSVALPGGGAGNDGLIHYSPAIDPELRNIAVLDASFAVRTLARGGGLVDRTTEAMRKCKTYELVTVRELPVYTGRHTLAANSKRTAELVRHTASTIRAVPATESVLIITFKDAGGRRTKRDQKPCPLRALQTGLRDAGIALEETVNVGGQARQRISWLTWGNETSLNEYSDCRHVILAGVLRRNPLDLTACMAGHRDDHSYRMKARELKDLERSEVAHCVLQGMSRGACRTVDAEGRAHAMHLTIFANVKGLKEALAESLPGVQWGTEGVPAGADTRTALATQAIRSYLKQLPPTVTKISVSKLKKAVGTDLGKDAWATAVSMAIVLLIVSGQRWCQPRGSRSLVRERV